MAEVGISVAAKIAEYLVGPVLRHGKYLFCAGKISRNVESTKEELKSTWESVQGSVEDARNRAEKVDDAVERWLNEVKSVMEEVEKLEQEIKEGGSFFRGWCPTLKGYHIRKQLSKKTNTMADLTQRSKFNPFSHRAPIPDIDYFSSGDFVYFKSTKLASQQLLEALQDDSIYMIGLYGMGGSGKTTLVKEVGKKAKESKLFNRVAFTTVSQPVDVRKIQGEIADLLGFKFETETEPGRARELSLRLQSGEQILVILDDVWSRLKLEDIGIPLDSHHKGCKVLLTTRRLQVCTLMDCQRKIPLNLLSEEEAWTLFRKHADIVDESSARLNGVAQEVARECKGLPIAIVAVATSLKGRKFLDHWNVALQNLKVSKPIDMEEGERDAYSCLRLSYDYLRSEEAKFLFLICSMFPEDHDISIEELFRYGMGLGICRGVDSFEIARNTVNVAIEDLIDSSLLMLSEKYNGEKYLKMHDMFRDVALWIASKESGTIMVDPAKDLNALSKDGSMKNCYAVSFWHKDIYPFPQLDAPNLEFILINSKYQLNLSYASFECIKELKVMAVINNIYQYHQAFLFLPQSTQWFNNLQTLQLVGQEIGDISFVVSLRRLKILDLQHSKFKALPIGIENLNELKLLDLSFCKIEEDCYEVIGRCSQLVELYMWGTVTLSNEFFWNDVALLRLQRYRLQIGKCYLGQWAPTISSMKDVYLEGLNMFNSGASIKVLLQRADFVLLEGLKGGCKSIIPEMVQAVGGMKELTTLSLHSTSAIECIIDTTTSDYDNYFRVDAEFPMLFRLELSKVYNLKEVCRGPPLLCILEKLESLNINTCNQLHCIFSGKWKLCNLKSLKIHNCAKLTSLFSISVAQTLLLLEEVTIVNCNELQCVFGEQNIGYGSSCQNEIEIVLPVLKRLSLRSLPKLVNIFPENFHLRWPSLIKLSCTDCTKLTTLCKYSMAGSEFRPLHSNMGSDAAIANVSQSSNEVSVHCEKLEILELKNLFELSFIWMDSPQILSLQYLQQLEVTGCEKVKSIFSTTISKRLLELTILVISHCGELEEIMAENEEPQNLSNTQLCFPKLKRLEVVQCNKLKCLFSTSTSIMFSQLEYLNISEAAQLKQAFRYRNEVGTDSMEKIMLPKLRTVELETLPNFVDISQGLKLHVMELYRIVVHECPKFAPVLAQKISLHQWRTELMEVQALATNDGQMSNEGSYLQPASTIEEEQKKIIASNVEWLDLKNLPDLMFIWKGPTLISFQDLVYLKVVGCSKLKSIFSDAIITSLPKLQRLNIEDCEELEEIISSNAEGGECHCIISPKSCPQQVCFPELTRVRVRSCDKMKFLFPCSMAEHLKRLKSLIITRASQLEHVFRCARETHDHDGDGIKSKIPSLALLQISQVPKFDNAHNPGDGSMNMDSDFMETLELAR